MNQGASGVFFGWFTATICQTSSIQGASACRWGGMISPRGPAWKL
jgi:hypothetical protein